MCSYKSRVCLYNSHLYGNHGFPFRIHRCLKKKNKKEININKILSRHLSASFTITNCSHCLGSHACTCSCKSQECWYSSHLCDSHDFHPNLRSRPLEVVSARKKGDTTRFFLLPNTSLRLLHRFTSILAFINFWRE